MSCDAQPQPHFAAHTSSGGNAHALPQHTSCKLWVRTFCLEAAMLLICLERSPCTARSQDHHAHKHFFARSQRIPQGKCHGQ